MKPLNRTVSRYKSSNVENKNNTIIINVKSIFMLILISLKETNYWFFKAKLVLYFNLVASYYLFKIITGFPITEHTTVDYFIN